MPRQVRILSRVHQMAPSVFDVGSCANQRTEVLQEWSSIDPLVKDDIDGYALVTDSLDPAAVALVSRLDQRIPRELVEHFAGLAV